MTPQSSNTDDDYWAQYDGLQYTKHQLLRRYLGAWFPILASCSGRVLYLDCNAGRGRHETGDEGSPILALKTLLTHQSCSKILRSTEVCFVFFENNPWNHRLLCNEIQVLGTLPEKVRVSIYPEDYEPHLRETVRSLRAKGQQLAPALVFVDPYGFAISMDLLNNLLDFPQCEIFVNFMYRYIDLAMHNPSQAAHMDRLFGTAGWRCLVDIQGSDDRAEATLSLFSSQLHAKYVTHMYMLGANNVLKYVLLHATNHPLGRERMKDAMWSIKPEGAFTAFERHSPKQPVLIVPDPDLRPLKDRLWATFSGKRVTVAELHSWLVGELYREPHLHAVLTEYRKGGIVTFNGAQSRVPYASNPVVGFPPKRPAGS